MKGGPFPDMSASGRLVMPTRRHPARVAVCALCSQGRCDEHYIEWQQARIEDLAEAIRAYLTADGLWLHAAQARPYDAERAAELAIARREAQDRLADSLKEGR